MNTEKRTLVTIVDNERGDSFLWLLTESQIALLDKLASADLLGYGVTYEKRQKIEAI